jgi:aromatic ring-opening dioxygenase catalytic subunit (LigB family)
MVNKKRSMLGKHKNISISISPEQYKFIQEHPTFNMSMFCQLALDDHIQLARAIENLRKEVVVK